jgi:hypothetical protein
MLRDRRRAAALGHALLDRGHKRTVADAADMLPACWTRAALAQGKKGGEPLSARARAAVWGDTLHRALPLDTTRRIEGQPRATDVHLVSTLS